MVDRHAGIDDSCMHAATCCCSLGASAVCRLAIWHQGSLRMVHKSIIMSICHFRKSRIDIYHLVTINNNQSISISILRYRYRYRHGHDIDIHNISIDRDTIDINVHVHWYRYRSYNCQCVNMKGLNRCLGGGPNQNGVEIVVPAPFDRNTSDMLNLPSSQYCMRMYKRTEILSLFLVHF